MGDREWAHLQGAPDGTSNMVTDVDALALNLIRETRPQLQIIPMVQNLADEKWNPELLAKAVGDEASRQRLIAAITNLVEGNKFAGVCVDFESRPCAQANLLTFIQELHAAFASRGLSLCKPFRLTIPVGTTRATGVSAIT